MKINMISVREAIECDKEAFEEVSACAISTLRKVYRPNTRALKNKGRISQGLKRLVALINARIVGTVQFCLDDDYVRVIGLGVHSDNRKQGVAKKLLEELAIIGRKSGVRCMALHTVKETGNHAIFQKLGFRIIEEQIDLFSESDRFETLNAVYMERDV